MNQELQLKIQAFVDGELPENEAGEIASQAAREPQVNDLIRELRHTRGAFKRHLETIRLPESREFYWSKIERNILALASVEEPVHTVPWFVWLKRLLAPAVAVSVLVVVGTFAAKWVGKGSPDIQVRTALEDSGAVTYRDHDAGMTLVWFSYPPTDQFAGVDSTY